MTYRCRPTRTRCPTWPDAPPHSYYPTVTVYYHSGSADPRSLVIDIGSVNIVVPPANLNGYYIDDFTASVTPDGNNTVTVTGTFTVPDNMDTSAGFSDPVLSMQAFDPYRLQKYDYTGVQCTIDGTQGTVTATIAVPSVYSFQFRFSASYWTAATEDQESTEQFAISNCVGAFNAQLAQPPSVPVVSVIPDASQPGMIDVQVTGMTTNETSDVFMVGTGRIGNANCLVPAQQRANHDFRRRTRLLCFRVFENSSYPPLTFGAYSDDVDGTGNNSAPELPTVDIVKTQDGSLLGQTPVIFTVSRTGDESQSLTVFYSLGGTAVPGPEQAPTDGISADGSDYTARSRSMASPAFTKSRSRQAAQRPKSYSRLNLNPAIRRQRQLSPPLRHRSYNRKSWMTGI